MDHAFRHPLTAMIVAFLIDIGLEVRASDIHEPTFLPGIKIDHGAMLVDESRLKHPGDLLHEAGHLAVTPANRRNQLHIDAGVDAAEEMMAIAWSYAALVHLNIAPAVVFHSDGYRGGSEDLIANFTNGRYVGVPMLQWVGMTVDEKQAKEIGIAPYPNMIKWLRDK